MFMKRSTFGLPDGANESTSVKSDILPHICIGTFVGRGGSVVVRVVMGVVILLIGTGGFVVVCVDVVLLGCRILGRPRLVISLI